MIAGTALSFLFLATHSIWAPLAAHYVMNVHQLVAARGSGMEPHRAPVTT